LSSGGYFAISSITDEVIAITPVRIASSGKGAKRIECSDGRGFPVRRLSASFSIRRAQP
jgi:hypothetical protein